jgi:hypothetical protein
LVGDGVVQTPHAPPTRNAQGSRALPGASLTLAASVKPEPTPPGAPESPSARPPVIPPTIPPGDARWVLALRVAQHLDGGTAAILTFEKRARLLAIARRLGLRPFDAGLVIAIVQDAARTGRPLGPGVVERLWMVGGAGEGAGSHDRREARVLAASLVAAVALAALIVVAAADWLLA